MTIFEIQPELEGYAVARTLDGLRWYVYKHVDNHPDHFTRVATISRLGPYFGNILAFEWHAQNMWRFRATDFVLEIGQRK